MFKAFLVYRFNGKDSAYNAGVTGASGSIPGSGRWPRGGKGYHSIILAWWIPWAEEPGRVQLQRVGHNWSDLACTGI